MNRKFVDEREPNTLMSIQQLKSEYLQRDMDEFEEITFCQWLNNCMQSNGGTLTEVKQ